MNWAGFEAYSVLSLPKSAAALSDTLDAFGLIGMPGLMDWRKSFSVPGGAAPAADGRPVGICEVWDIY